MENIIMLLYADISIDIFNDVNGPGLHPLLCQSASEISKGSVYGTQTHKTVGFLNIINFWAQLLEV